MADLDGTAVIVTGAGKGIGFGIANVLARAGAQVAITDIDEASAREAAERLTHADGRAIGLRHDVTSSSSCHQVVRDVSAAFGRVDVLVNNAGISQRIGFMDIEESDWDRMLEVNLKSVYLMTQAVFREMLDRRSGRVINVASLVGKAGSHPLFSHYVASKFAVVGLTQSLAQEFAEFDILVNAVCPGVVRTPLWDPVLQGSASDQGVSIGEAWEAALAPIPLGRAQDPEDIGHAVAFLASPGARNITGESINVNGGQLMD